MHTGQNRSGCARVGVTAGYRNYYYGKWHAGPGSPYDHHCEGVSYPSYNNPYTKPEYKQYLTEYNLPKPRIQVEEVLNRYGGIGENYVEGEPFYQTWTHNNEFASGVQQTPKDTHEAFFVANLACDRLREIAKSDSGEPWHMRVDFWGPHPPYFPTPEYAGMYDPKEIPMYPSYMDPLTDKPATYRHNNTFRSVDMDAWPMWAGVLARCYEQIALVDDAGGRVLDTLEELGLAENSIVIWTTDHGDALASHGGRINKGNYMIEELLRVPFAIRWPGRIPSGTVSERLVSHIDLAPTFLDAAGTSFPEEVHGTSILPMCTGETDEWRDDLMVTHNGDGSQSRSRIMVKPPYKYIATKNDIDELYNHDEAPYEMVNLAGRPEYSDLCDEMRSRICKWQERTQDELLDLADAARHG